MNVRVNKWLDLLDRAGWTAVETAAGSVLTILTGATLGWRAALTVVGTSTLIAVCKVVVAQRAGRNELGAAVPGQVLEETARPESVR